MEMPTMTYISQNHPYLAMQKYHIDVDRHLATEPVIKDSDSFITKIGSTHAHQYVKFDADKTPVFKIDAEKTRLASIPDKVGAKVVSLTKFNTKYQYPDIKKVYDHLLDTHDYVRTDDVQYPGGKNTWLKLVPDYEKSGHHIYLDTNDGLKTVNSQHISDNHESIWNSDHAHVLISKNPLV